MAPAGRSTATICAGYRRSCSATETRLAEDQALTAEHGRQPRTSRAETPFLSQYRTAGRFAAERLVR